MKTFTPVEVLYVGPSATGDKSGSSRSNLITFSDAIQKIDFNGKIYVTSGTYSLGSISLTNYIHFIGDSKSNTIIETFSKIGATISLSSEQNAW